MIDVPVPADAPPHEAVYQCHAAPDDSVPVAESVAELPLQIEAVEGLTDVGFAGRAVIVTTALWQEEKQLPFSARA